MVQKKVRSIAIVCILALMMFSAGIVTFPSASALAWTQDDDSEFSEGSFTNTEIVGSGTPAYVALVKGNENWGDLDPLLEPSAREGPVMAYDSTRDVLIMFGGYDGTYLDETWEYDYATNTWTQILTIGSPPGREWSSMAYDSTNDVFVLFGGLAPANLADTWEYDPSTQTWTETSPPFSPQLMYSYALTFDSSADRVILAAKDFASSTFETWAYDASLDSWTMRGPPAQPGNRASHTITYDTSIGRTVLFGGVDGFTYLSDVWEYDYSADTWVETSPASGPSARFGHAAAYRTWDGSVLIYGGSEDGGGYPTDTWKYEYVSGSPRWTQVNTILDPGSRRYLVMDYDSTNNATVVFGGNSGLGRLNDTWELAPYYSAQGNFVSSYLDTAHTDTIWQRIYWNWTPAAQPANTNLSFQIAVSNLSSGPWNFVGPDGTVSTYYTNPGQQIRLGTVGRHLRYLARLITFDGLDTPHMDDVTIVYTIPTLSPKVVLTDPYQLEFGVELTRNITVLFSEPMSTGTVTWTIDPNPGGWTEEWDSAEATLYLNHSVLLEEAAVHTVEITGGQDKGGNPLVAGPVPNPWIFVTTSVPPYIEETEPAHTDVDVALDYPIWMNFSEPMNTSTVMWNIVPDPNPGGWGESWQNSNMTLVLTHPTDYSQCVEYVVDVTGGEDTKGIGLVPGPAPNPWIFTAACFDPFVQDTDPMDQQIDVAVDYSITVTFSKEVDNTTLSWTIDPDPGGWTRTWGPQNKTLTLTHSNTFASCTAHTVEVLDIQDLDGGHLIPGVVPNPWRFMTICPNPHILITNPSDAQQDVPTYENITILFSETMDTTTLSWNIQPDPGGWIEFWTAMDAQVQLNNTNFFGECTDYIVNVTYAEDLAGNPLVPGFAPNPWTFNTTCLSPVITETSPVNNTADVPLSDPVVIYFSRSMNTTTLSWTIFPDPNPLGWGESWQNNNKTLVLTHPTDYDEAALYEVIIVYVEDEDGYVLASGPVPNPFYFTTGSDDPYVLLTDPYDGEIDVELDRTINITFSEPMATGTVTWEITPNPGGWTTQWLLGDTVLSLSHSSNPFSECIVYIFEVTYGEDLVGNPLVPGPVANPFTFLPICVSPFITDTYPVNNTIDFPVDESLWINFSESMDTTTVGWIIQPFVGHQGVWSNVNRTLRLDHITPYTECDTYKVTMSGDDMDGNPLIAGPADNPFSFTAICENPQIVSTDPYDGELGVGLMDPIVITFSEEMDNTTVTWTIAPNPGGWTASWESGNTVLNLTHTNPFTGMTLYTVEVLTGDDTVGLPLIPGLAPNPWVFTTALVNPYITTTVPPDGDTGVALDADIVVDFSKEIDNSTFLWTIAPNPGGWSETWTLSNTRVTMSHTNAYDPLTLYTVDVTQADDLMGNPLVLGPVPNPWTFTTGIGVPPSIVDTYPADGATDVPLGACIWVNFSEPMDQATLIYAVVPDPGGWTASWTNGNQTLTLCHTNPFAEGMLYTVTVAANDMDGNGLVLGPVPNPWTFTTVIIAPWITDTSPLDGAVGVPLGAPIIVNFNEPMDTATLIYSVVPDPGGLGTTWTNFDMTLTIDHNPFTECTMYTVTISVQDLQGQPLVAGPVPNPWTFDTICPVTPPSGLTVTRMFPTTVRLDWNVVPGADSYNVYESSDRFAAFPGGWNVVSTVNNFYELAQLDDGQTHYYVVRAFNLASGESGNSTMGVKINKAFTLNPLMMSVYWMSLPYNSEYATASDIANELTETNVNVIAKWDRASQSIISYYFARGSWRGRDFTLSAGDGFYVSAVANFNWYIVGTDSDITIDMPHSLLPFKKNEHWISVPYTGTYAKASDIVIDIEGGTGPGTNVYISELGKWDATTQTSSVYYYDPAGWTGDDFVIEPGDGIYIKVVASYNWQPVLLTPEV